MRKQLFVSRDDPLRVGWFDDGFEWHTAEVAPVGATLTDARRLAARLATERPGEFQFWTPGLEQGE